MEEKLALCGDDCGCCPRYLARSGEELDAAALLWYKVGWRTRVVSREEIACTGCAPGRDCTYGLMDCTRDHGVDRCSRCGEFPCPKIDDMLARSEEYKRVCRQVCTPRQYAMLEKAFFNKEYNLKK